jgi:hypothetical protein
MIENKAVAEEVSKRLLAVNGALDEAVLFVQASCSADELERSKQAIGEVMYKVFEEGLIPIYRNHPDLAPEGLNVSGASY